MNRLEVLTLTHIIDVSNEAITAGGSAETAVGAHGKDRLMELADHHYLCPGCQASIEVTA